MINFNKNYLPIDDITIDFYKIVTERTDFLSSDHKNIKLVCEWKDINRMMSSIKND